MLTSKILKDTVKSIYQVFLDKTFFINYLTQQIFMEEFLFYKEVTTTSPRVVVDIILTKDITKAVEIFTKDSEHLVSNLDIDNVCGKASFYVGQNFFYVRMNCFTIDSEYDITKLTILADKLLTDDRLFDYSNELGDVIGEEDLKSMLKRCKKDFVSTLDKIEFLKTKDLYIESLTVEQVNFYYKKFANKD